MKRETDNSRCVVFDLDAQTVTVENAASVEVVVSEGDVTISVNNRIVFTSRNAGSTTLA